MRNFYNQTAEEVLRQLNGVSGAPDMNEIGERQKKYGPNELSEGKKKSKVQIFLEQFKDFLVVILIGAALISMFLGETESAVVIFAVIILNAILGTVQTVKAEHSLESLKQLSSPEAKVERGGRVVKVPGRELTIGDIVHLEAGDSVPADGRIIESASLTVDESALTGESLGVAKTSEKLEGELPLGDRTNMLYSGSFVTYGRGKFVVTGIGMETEVGRIAGLLKSTSEKKTPLQVNLDQFGKKLSIVIIALCAVLFGLQIIRGGEPADAFLFAVALAVAAIPEALSSIVTIVLAFGTQRMAKEGAVIRKLQAVEGLGSVSVICSDKTGTLTQNKMSVEYFYTDGKSVSAEEINPEDRVHRQMMTFAMLCNDASVADGKEIGDPTETAFVNLGDRKGVAASEVRKAYPRLSELPFDSDRKLMSTLHEMDGQRIMVIKGATDVMMKRISKIQKGEEIRGIEEADLAEIAEANEAFSREGLRVLAVGCRNIEAGRELDISDEKDITFLGLAAMMDPPRAESAAAVADCKSAGIRPVMITGDHKITAAAIAKRIGILDNMSEACEGAEIDGLTDEELREFVENKSVYARVTPEHKIRIVRAWQEKGCIVSMTGDGVNDAPALKQADIGVAMGITGTEVSKDASSMVLTDDNFSTIVKAVENGRNVYANIKKSIQFLLSGNFAAILAVLFASLLALPVPFAAVHLLFINLVTDSLPAIALGLEPYRHGVMKERPRPVNESIMTKPFMLQIGRDGLVMAVTTMTAFFIGLSGAGSDAAAGNALLASTMAFGTLCLARLIHGYNCKSENPVLFRKAFFNNRYMQGAFIAGFVLLTLVLTVPALSSWFMVQTLTFGQLVTVYALALVNLPVIQLLKAAAIAIKKKKS